MPRESVIFGIAGVFFGILVGWMIGTQQVRSTANTELNNAPAAAAPSAAQPRARFDEARATALAAAAGKNQSDAASRVQLGDLYFDAGRYSEASKWYEEALAIDPKNIDASTDLGITYYYANQADRALAQFDRSLAIDPKHAKTLLNIGIVRAFGKQDLEGAAKVWQQVIEIAPNSDEARMAQRGLEGLRSAHPVPQDSQPAAPPRSK